MPEVHTGQMDPTPCTDVSSASCARPREELGQDEGSRTHFGFPGREPRMARRTHLRLCTVRCSPALPSDQYSPFELSPLVQPLPGGVRVTETATSGTHVS